MDFDHDVVVVGSGVAGAICAWKLSTRKNGKKILMLDASDNPFDDAARTKFVHDYRLSTSKNALSPYASLASAKAAPSSDGTGDPVVMNRYYVETGPDLFKSGFQRMVGGSTWVWRGNTPRFVPNDFQLRTKYSVADDWPITYDELEPYYQAAEEQLGVSGNTREWEGIFGAYRSADFPMAGIAASYGDRLVKEAIGNLEIDGTAVKVVTVPQARNSKEYDGRSACQGNSTCIPICPSGAKYDASVHVKKAVANGVELRNACVVTRLMADPDGAVHTVYFKSWKEPEKGEQHVTANIVVLAANAVEIPKLWLLSGLKNKSDQVGRNLMDHPAFEITGLFGEPLYPFRGPQSTMSIEAFRDGDYRKTTGAFRMTIGNDGWGRSEPPSKTLEDQLWDPKAKKIRAFGKDLQAAVADRASRLLRISYSTEQLPNPDNRVILSDERDGLDLPRPKIAYKVDDYSKRALVYGYDIARRIWEHLERTAGAKEIAPKQPPFSYNGAGHIMGTMRMGTEPSRSVVDDTGRSHDHPNVYVVGSSVFVTGGTANPTLTLAALALRTADAIP